MLAFSAVPTPLYAVLPGARRLLLVHDHGRSSPPIAVGRRDQPLHRRPPLRLARPPPPASCPRWAQRDRQRPHLHLLARRARPSARARSSRGLAVGAVTATRDRLDRRAPRRRPRPDAAPRSRAARRDRRQPRRHRLRPADLGDARRLGRRSVRRPLRSSSSRRCSSPRAWSLISPETREPVAPAPALAPAARLGPGRGARRLPRRGDHGGDLLRLLRPLHLAGADLPRRHASITPRPPSPARPPSSSSPPAPPVQAVVSRRPIRGRGCAIGTAPDALRPGDRRPCRLAPAARASPSS